MERPQQHYFSQVIKVTINIAKSYWRTSPFTWVTNLSFSSVIFGSSPHPQYSHEKTSAKFPSRGILSYTHPVLPETVRVIKYKEIVRTYHSKENFRIHTIKYHVLFWVESWNRKASPVNTKEIWIEYKLQLIIMYQYRLINNNKWTIRVNRLTIGETGERWDRRDRNCLYYQ